MCIFNSISILGFYLCCSLLFVLVFVYCLKFAGVTKGLKQEVRSVGIFLRTATRQKLDEI